MTVIELAPESINHHRPVVRRQMGPSWSEAALSDATLVSAAGDGQDWAWPALVKRYGGLVASIARSYRLGSADAADLQQIVWMRLIENLPRIRRPEVIGAWIASVTRNECLALQRRADREVTTDDERTFAGEADADVEGDLLAGERRTALDRALRQLPSRGRVLLETLLDHPGLSYHEVGQRVGMPIGSIGPTRRRCLERLRAVPELVDLVD